MSTFPLINPGLNLLWKLLIIFWLFFNLKLLIKYPSFLRLLIKACKLIKDNFKIPVFAYQVSGEYSLIKNGIKNNILSEDAIYESLISFKRAGANAIVTYYADKITKILE